MLGGVVAGSDELVHRVYAHREIAGTGMDPHVASLFLRSLKTLRIRVERQTETARGLARRLEAHPAVQVVRYPGFGGLLSFDVVDGAAARRVETATQLIMNATSLGGTHSVIESRYR